MQRSLQGDVALLADEEGISIGPADGVDGQPALAIRFNRPGAIQAINHPELAKWAREHDCLAVMTHSIGDFVEPEDLLIEVYGDPGDTVEAKHALNGLVALGIERTIEQDPALAIRIMVDVANKGPVGRGAPKKYASKDARVRHPCDPIGSRRDRARCRRLSE